jgi:glucosamine kinase
MMTETDIVVGVDAGGSKTRVVVANSRGEQLADTAGPPAAMSPGNAEHSAAVIAQLVTSALARAARSDVKPLVLHAGVAGTGREAEQLALQSALEQHELADEVAVETDATAALSDAFGDGAGIILIAGTGSIAFGRSPAGILARCGGWGIAFGDEGSGAWIGRRALSVVAAAHDGREPETALTGAILTAAQVNDVEQLIPWAIAADRETLAALAPSVIAMAMQEDARANSIIDMAVEELVLHVRALGQRLFLDDRAAFSVALAGGLLGRGSLLRKRLIRRLKTAVPGATVNSMEIDAARGAVKLALQIAAAIPSTH